MCVCVCVCVCAGLTRALYLDSEGTEVTCPDPQAGLYVRTRAGQVVKVDIPPDHIAFQVRTRTNSHFIPTCHLCLLLWSAMSVYLHL